MPFLRELLSRLLHLDNHRLARLGWARPLQLLTYRTYGTAGRFYVKGRLLTDPGLAPATAADSRWRNFRNMARRFLSYEIAGAGLVAERAGGAPQPVATDHEGYFTLVLEAPPQPPPGALLWQPVAVRLARLPGGTPLPARPVQAVAEVLVPPAGAEFGVISDLDDTVFESGATNFLRMGFTVLLRNALSYQPFAGVGEFYRALQLGCTGRPDNPFFYISSSPWNLYDALDEFLALHRIPKGALLLRDVGLRPRNPVPAAAEGLAATAHFGHKLHEIENVLHAYPHLPFVLLGDSGQEDARIYREVVRRYPGRIRAVYIRDVQVPKRAVRIPQLVAELHAENVEMLLVPDYATAMRHAAARGLIADGAVAVKAEEI